MLFPENFRILKVILLTNSDSQLFYHRRSSPVQRIVSEYMSSAWPLHNQSESLCSQGVARVIMAWYRITTPPSTGNITVFFRTFPMLNCHSRKISAILLKTSDSALFCQRRPTSLFDCRGPSVRKHRR